MPAKFNESGVAFQYPENWKLEREEIENGWLVTVQSPDTAFFMLSRREDNPTSKVLAQEALDDLRASYTDLEVEAASSQLAGRAAEGFDIRFFYLDLTNTTWLRAFHAGGATLLALWQANDLEIEANEPVLRAIAQSLTIK
jgi:hypothetical protein